MFRGYNQNRGRGRRSGGGVGRRREQRHRCHVTVKTTDQSRVKGEAANLIVAELQKKRPACQFQPARGSCYAILLHTCTSSVIALLKFINWSVRPYRVSERAAGPVLERARQMMRKGLWRCMFTLSCVISRRLLGLSSHISSAHSS